MTALSYPTPVAAEPSERPALAELAALLRQTPRGASVIGIDGKTVELPQSVVTLLQQIARHLSHEQMVTIVPIAKELTTQQAADILNVSRPYLIKLLEAGEIPYTKTGAHRRIRYDDLVAYKARGDDRLAEMTRLGEELEALEREYGLA